MNTILSSLAAIAVYIRITEMGHASAAIICGVAMGVLMQYVFNAIKKSAGAERSERTREF